MATRQEATPIPNLPGYIFEEKLGAESYGTVYKARLIATSQSRPSSAACDRPDFFAIKCINRQALTRATQDLLINELKLLKHIKHENIIKMYDFQWNENYTYIVMEYCAGGDISMFIRSRQQLSETRARPFVQQIVKNMYSYDNLKPENILLKSVDKPILKVADFGAAQHIGTRGSRGSRGTLLYMAPGILYKYLFGQPPFSFSCVDELIEEIKSDVSIEIPNDTWISSECRNSLESLLQRQFLSKINYEESGDIKRALDYRVRAWYEYITIIKGKQ
ncbi:unnamed protein product [Rotaria sp. Silwood2]|nr:unnamed protein product [Rotaria sp. Silwood2]CAF4556490.1 unnamed protein product [Rotaria sp. Silwood2]